MPDLAQLLKSTYQLDTEHILTELDKYELSDAQKGVLATSIVLDRLGSQQRRFSYANALEPTEPDCKATFARSFVHADWQDGEDVVSAQGSNGDEGFNTRFHKIEDDLDSLARDSAKAFECLMELRVQLATLFEEVRTEINRINADIQGLKPQTGGGTKLPPIFEVGPPVEVFPPRGPRWPFGDVVDPVRPDRMFGGVVPWMSGAAPGLGYPAGPNPFVTDPTTVWTTRANETVGMIAGMPATRVSEGMFNGEKVELWKTPIGAVLTPVGEGAAPGEGYVDPRIEMSGQVGAWTAANADKIREKLGDGEFTRADLDREFGEVDIGGGLRLRDAIKNIAPAETFASPDMIVDKVAEVQAGAIRDAGASAVASIGVVGLNVGEAAPAAAHIETFTPIVASERELLAGAGLTSVEKVAEASTEKLIELLTVGGQDPADAAARAGRIRGMARALGRLGG